MANFEIGDIVRLISNKDWGSQWRNAIPVGTLLEVIKDHHDDVCFVPLIDRKLPFDMPHVKADKRCFVKI